MLNLNSLLIGSDNPKRLIKFYEKVFNHKSLWDEGNWGGFDCVNCHLTIGPHSEVHGKANEPQRILINFEVDDVAKEFERIKKLGAAVIAEPYNPMQDDSMTIATFADPDGNYFQLMSPMRKSN